MFLVAARSTRSAPSTSRPRSCFLNLSNLRCLGLAPGKPQMLWPWPRQSSVCALEIGVGRSEFLTRHPWLLFWLCRASRLWGRVSNAACRFWGRMSWQDTAPDRSQALANVFLTGCTGFVGAFLLRAILRSTEACVYCLVCMAPRPNRRRTFVAYLLR